ncbi:MAG TPA: hypothetical protein PKI86_05140, partial [Chitinophagales bacterium]|nr:hypothetical protein [Chitinophagales bacterium]
GKCIKIARNLKLNMFEINKINKKNFILPSFVLVILLLLLFGKIIIKPEYVSFGDNTFLFKKLFISAWLPYENNGVSAESLISTYTRDVLFTKAFLVTGMKFEIISKLSYLLPIFLSLLIFFLLLRKISDSFLYALIGSILFILSVTSIEHMTVSFVLYFFHVSSLLILTYFIFRWGFDWEKIRYKGILALVFLSFLNLHPFYFLPDTILSRDFLHTANQ